VGCVGAAIATQRRGKHVLSAMSKHARLEELLVAMFSMLSVPRLHGENKKEKLVSKIQEA
jgi:hypothetical protein